MYSIVLFAHAWLRWIVLALAVVVIVRAASALRADRPWLPADRAMSSAFVGVIDLQLLLGLSLWLALSPLVAAARANMKAAMHNPALRFFVVEHLTSMLLALIAAHVTSVLVRRAATDRLKHKRLLIGCSISLICLIVGVPWPGLPYARPLFHAL